MIRNGSIVLALRPVHPPEIQEASEGRVIGRQDDGRLVIQFPGTILTTAAREDEVIFLHAPSSVGARKWGK